MEVTKESAPRTRSRAKEQEFSWSEVGMNLAIMAAQGLVLGTTSALATRLISPSQATPASGDGELIALPARKAANA